MTIYKPIPIEAETAAEVAVALANGDEVPDTSETGIEQTEYEGVASYIFDPIVVTAGQRQRHHHRGRASTPSTTSAPASTPTACEAAGIS